MELKREFYDYLVKWKAENTHQCLLVNGARQIGKTYIIEKFGRENYDSFIEINFVLEPECMSIFDGALDVRSICERLTAIRDDVEIEFVVETEDGVVPIELKSTDGRSRSLDVLLESETIPYGIKLTGGNVGVSGKKVTLPHYMAMFL